MIEWLFGLILLIFIIWLCYQQNTKTELLKYNIVSQQLIQDKPTLLVEAEMEYGVQYTLPQASAELVSYGIPQSTIDQNSAVIQSNIDTINQLNQKSLEEKKADPASTPPKFGITIATAYTDEEFRKGYFGLNIPKDMVKFGLGNNANLIPSTGKKIPLDPKYVIQNTVNPKGSLNIPVYDQQQCGCCWVVSSSNVLNHKLQKQNVKLSDITFPNQYVYCLPKSAELSGYSNGCQGGIPSDVFITALTEKSLETMINSDSTVVFNQNITTCGSGPTQYGVKNEPIQIVGLIGLYYEDAALSIPSFQFFSLEDIRKLEQNQNNNKYGLFNYQFTNLAIPTSEQVKMIKYLISVNGPMVIGINADVPDFKSYRSGNLSLSKGSPDHAVLLYGYGTNAGEEVWFVQNSWGVSKWGENGFVNARISNSYITLITGFVTNQDVLAKLR